MRCRGLGALCCLWVADHFADGGKMVCFRGVTKMYAAGKHFVEVNKMLTAEVLRPAGCCTFKGFGMLPNKFLQGKRLCTYKDTACSAYAGTAAHYLQVQGPLQEHTTFCESLVCYTSPGGVDSSGFVRGSRLGRCSGWRSK